MAFLFGHVIFKFRSNVLENTRFIAVGAHFTHTYKKEVKKSTFRICGKKKKVCGHFGSQVGEETLQREDE